MDMSVCNPGHPVDYRCESEQYQYNKMTLNETTVIVYWYILYGKNLFYLTFFLLRMCSNIENTQK